MKNINAKDRGRAAFGSNKTRQPMNDTRFVELMYAAIEGNELTSRAAKDVYISDWKSGWDEAKAENTEPAPSKATKKTKKKAKKKSKKKAKK